MKLSQLQVAKQDGRCLSPKVQCQNGHKNTPQIPRYTRSSTTSPRCLEATETNVSPPSTGQDHSKQSTLSGLGEVFTSVFGSSSAGGYSKDTIDKIN